MTNTLNDLDLLLEPQRAHATKLLNSIYLNGVSADLSETGTGKTYSAGWIAKQLQAPVVVVCPKVVVPVWRKVLSSFKIKAHVIINYEKLIRGNTEHLSLDPNLKTHYPENYEIKFPKDALVILDEVHKCKSWKSKSGNFLTALVQQKYKLLMLSATSATNPLEMKAFGFATHLHGLFDFPDFLTSGGAYRNKFGSYVIDTASDKTVEFMKGVHRRLFEQSSLASRMTREEFGSIFPDNHVTADAFDMGGNTEKINHVYSEMEYELNRLEERALNYSQHAFAVIIEARRKVELLKIPSMVEFVHDLYDEGISPVVFLNFNDSVIALNKLLNKTGKYDNKIGHIIGGQTEKAREADIEAFQNNSFRIMIANLAAGNLGVSLHDLHGGFPRFSLINPSWSAVNVLQALGRIHRAEGKSPCKQRIMYASGTIEDRICENVQAKLNNLSALNDGDLSGVIVIK